MERSNFSDIFPSVDCFELTQRLQRPSGIADVVLDTDAYNEIDDQYALAYLVRSTESCRVRAITAAPFYSDPSLVQRSFNNLTINQR